MPEHEGLLRTPRERSSFAFWGLRVLEVPIASSCNYLPRHGESRDRKDGSWLVGRSLWSPEVVSTIPGRHKNAPRGRDRARQAVGGASSIMWHGEW